MALTQILRQECPVCKKIAVEKSKLKIGRTIIVSLACGHKITSERVAKTTDSAYDSIIFSDGGKPRPYQIEAIRFAEESNIRCIFADEQGLGKTVESASLLRLHPEKLLPCVIVCPATVKLQWMWEIHRICAKTGENGGARDKQFLTQVISSGKERAMPGFQIYVVTYDILKHDDLFEYLPANSVKTLIIDECQKIKNHLSDRAKAVQRLVRDQNIEHIIPMSGTPISNNAAEYFTVLNLVDPKRYPHFQKFIDENVDAYSNGYATKYGGLKNREKFHEDTKDLIIRRTKSEVLKDLPAKERKFHHCELNKNLNKEYLAAMKELEKAMYNDTDEGFGPTDPKIAIMSRLRHITGKSKVVDCVDFATEFLLSTDRKLVIFTHHQDVMGMVEIKLNEWMKDGGYPKVCVLHAGLNGDERQRVIDKFKLPENRIMLCIFTEGINLQFCSDAVILERQWTPTREEQAEDRFHRFGQQNNVSITYMITSGTIDEYFTELVEIKRARVAATIDNQEIVWNQQSLMKELAEILVTRGMNAWRL
jgi:SNF2 family DNA or RNA helicase